MKPREKAVREAHKGLKKAGTSSEAVEQDCGSVKALRVLSSGEKRTLNYPAS